MARSGLLAMFALALMALAGPVAARVERHVVHSAALEGNLEGNSPDRTVYVILPPGYDQAKDRRYPVVYFLHGFGSTAERMMDRVPFDEQVKAAARTAGEVIVVVPDGHSKYDGSMYSASPTTGDYEAYIARDVVAWVDRNFRTIAARESRGLSGHSMGGYGTMRIGMRYPEVFGALYAMNPCCLTARPIETAEARYEAMTPEQVAAGDFITHANFAIASAWSPDPQKPPFYADLGTKDGKPDMGVFARWWANAPAVMASQSLAALHSMRAIAMDAGDKDFVLFEGEGMHRELDRLGVTHGWTIYDGDHMNRMPERFGAFVLPFFVQHLQGTRP